MIKLQVPKVCTSCPRCFQYTGISSFKIGIQNRGHKDSRLLIQGGRGDIGRRENPYNIIRENVYHGAIGFSGVIIYFRVFSIHVQTIFSTVCLHGHFSLCTFCPSPFSFITLRTLSSSGMSYNIHICPQFCLTSQRSLNTSCALSFVVTRHSSSSIPAFEIQNFRTYAVATFPRWHSSSSCLRLDRSRSVNVVHGREC